MTTKGRLFLSLSLLSVVLLGCFASQFFGIEREPTANQLTASAIVATNQAVETLIAETQRAVQASATAWQQNDFQTAATLRATLTNVPYDPVLYATRQQELRIFTTAAGPATYVLFYAQETQLAAAYQGTPTWTPAPTATAYAGCVWNWARRDLPDTTHLAQVALNFFQVRNATVRVEAYGENCLDGQTQKVQYFAAMTTDFYVTILVDDLTDQERLGRVVWDTYVALTSGLYESWLPARYGYLDITFTAGGQQKRLRAMFTAFGTTVDEQKLMGAALLDKLGGLR
jgi:hypothetical protein